MMFVTLPDLPLRMIACDYDGTVAVDGVMSLVVGPALVAARGAGFLISLVTGREFDDLRSVCTQLDLFDVVVAENGAVMYFPGTDTAVNLALRPSSEFLAELTRNSISFSVGRVIVGTHSDEEARVRAIIRDMNLQLEVILNRDSAMILPAGINKATGLAESIRQIGVEMSQVVAIGDAENDIAFMEACGYAVAVANAIDSVKAIADAVTGEPNGEGIARFIRHRLLGTTAEAAPVHPGTEIVC